MTALRLLALLLLVAAPFVLGGILGALALPRRPRLGRWLGAAAGPLLGLALLWASGASSVLTGAPPQAAGLGSIREQCAALGAAIRAHCAPPGGAGTAAACTRNRAVFVGECLARRHVAAMP